MMKIFVFLVFLALAVTGDAAPPKQCHPMSGLRIDFSDPQELTERWRFYGGIPFVRKTDFFIATEPSAENGRVMVVDARRSSGLMMTDPQVDLRRFPILHWRWRVVRPIDWKSVSKEPDDQAGVIYVGTGTYVRQDAVCYSWESRTRVGEVKRIIYNTGLINILRRCLRNHSTPTGEWVEEYRNVAADFEAAFGKPLVGRRLILSVGGNSQHARKNTRLEIDYIEFIPKRKPEVP